MEQVLEDLKAFMENHHACFVRTNDGTSLTLQVPKLHKISDSHFDEFMFEEEISVSDINYQRYNKIDG